VAWNDPPDYGPSNPSVRGNYGPGDPRGGQESEPVPRWRKPLALVGWAVLIVVLIGVIIYGSLELMKDQEPTPATPSTTTSTTATTSTPTTTATTTTPTTTTPETTTTTTTTTSTRRHFPQLPTFPHH